MGRGKCETPKSPPGDYNVDHGGDRRRVMVMVVRVKHLNPRQGITTRRTPATYIWIRPCRRVKHLNPRQGITTPDRPTVADHGLVGVKHLNPRQGITTRSMARLERRGRRSSVKHLNPRQGITTRRNLAGAGEDRQSVKHLNPRQGITTRLRRCACRGCASSV